MARRSRFAKAAEDWIRSQGPQREYSSHELWDGLCASVPDLTRPSESRKTPRATCMRDLRKDPLFEVQRGRIRLALVDDRAPAD